MKSVLINIIIIFSISTTSAVNASGIEKASAPIYNFDKSEKFEVSYQSNSELDFYKYISGVTAAKVQINNNFKETFSFDKQFLSKFNKMIRSYLSAIGFEDIAVSQNEHELLMKTRSLEEVVKVNIETDVENGYMFNLKLSFTTCNYDIFEFYSSVDYYLDENWDSVIYEKLSSMFFHQIKKDKSNRLKMISTLTDWNEKKLIEHFTSEKTDKIEGIYVKYASENSNQKIAVVRKNDFYQIIFLNGLNEIDWKEGEQKGILNLTAIEGFYQVNWLFEDKLLSENVFATEQNSGMINFEFMGKNKKSVQYLKIFPNSESEKFSTNDNCVSSGTGFAISLNGVFITNNHVIEGCQNVEVKLSDGNLYSAKVLGNDIKNDLAAIQIDDEKFSGFNNLPFTINSQKSGLGEEVFTLGFPLIQTMGEDIKLTNGIISSENGFRGNSSSYQITVPINPGNSGGPLFDRKGNMIGVISARHAEAENSAYAVKSERLVKFLKRLNIEFTNTEKYHSENLSLSEMADSYKNYIALIKVK